jgi:hypothetical protein
MAPAANAPHPQQPPCQCAEALPLIAAMAAIAPAASAALRSERPKAIVIAMYLREP